MKTRSHFIKLLYAIFLSGFITINPPENTHAQSATNLHAQATTTIFAAIGDYGLAGQPEADVANLVKSWNPDFIVTLGDNNYPRGAADGLDQNIGQYYHEYIYPYKGKYGNGSATRRFYPALGNHDWDTGNPNAYFNYFGFYNERGYYEFAQGPLHFYMLDSDTREPDGTSSTSKQAKWLKNALAASTSPFNLVVLHHAPYSSGAHGSTTYMQWPFKEWGADAVLAGHDHIYERLLINNLPYFVNGIGGAELYKFETILPESQARFNADYGALRIEATSTTLKFQMYTRTGILVDEYIVGQSIPTVTSITPMQATSTNATSVDYLVTFSEAVTGVDVSDFSLSTNGISDASILSVSGMEKSYVVSVNTGTTSGTLQLNLLDNDSILNLTSNPLNGPGIGNGNYTSSGTYTTDKIPPSVVSITRVQGSPTSALSVDYAVSFSEPVSGVDGADFSLFSSGPSGAFISNIVGAGSLYTITINTGSGDTILRLDLIDNKTILDAVGNPTQTSFSGESYTIDKSTPTITSIVRAGGAQTNAATVDFIVTFSEPVSGLDPSDFALSTFNINGAFVSNIVNSDPFYVVTVNSGSGDGSIRLDLIDDDSVINAFGTSLGNAGVGNGNFSSGESYTIDKTAPVVTSIQRASANPSSAPSVDFIVTFSELVTGVDLGDFIAATTDVSGAGPGKITDVNPFYIISVNTGAGSGSLRLDLADQDSIIDLAGNPLGGAGIGNGNFISGESFTISKQVVNFPSPTLLDPRQSLITNNLQTVFSWTIVRNARAYEILIARDENFTQLLTQTLTDRTSFIPAMPFQDGLYFWKVRAYNMDLLPGKYSATQVFTMDSTPPSSPVAASPANNTTAPRRPWLQWLAVADATQFQIEVDNRPDFTNPEFRDTSSKLYLRAGGLSKGQYFWRIKARDAAGNWSGWSPTYSFTVK